MFATMFMLGAGFGGLRGVVLQPVVNPSKQSCCQKQCDQIVTVWDTCSASLFGHNRNILGSETLNCIPYCMIYFRKNWAFFSGHTGYIKFGESSNITLKIWSHRDPIL